MDIAAVRLGDAPRVGEAKACPAVFTRDAAIDLDKRLEDGALSLLGDPFPIIEDEDAMHAVDRFKSDADRAALIREFDGVLEDMSERALNFIGIADDWKLGQLFFVDEDRGAAFFEDMRQAIDGPAEELDEILLRLLKMDLPRLDRAHIKQRINCAPKLSDGAQHRRDRFFLRGVQRPKIAALKEPKITDNRRERRRELMGHISKEVAP